MKNFACCNKIIAAILNNNAMNNVIPARGVNAFSPDLVGITLFVPNYLRKPNIHVKAN